MSALKRPALMGSLLVRKGAASATGQTEQSAQPEVIRVAPRPIVALPVSPYLKAPPVLRAKVAGAKVFGRQKQRSAAKKMRLTLGLDSELHLRLKLAAVHKGTHMRSLILIAIEEYVSALGPEIQDGRCACLQAGLRQGSCGHKIASSGDGTGTD